MTENELNEKKPEEEKKEAIELDKSEVENSSPEDENIPEPKKIERKIKHSKTDVVRSPDADLDTKWGWAIEFPTAETLEVVWLKLKSFLEERSNHPLSGKVKWLTLDPRGYFSPSLRHFISFTGWGLQFESLPSWFKKNIGDINKPVKEVEASEELADGNWNGYIVKDTINLEGFEFYKLESFSHKNRSTIEEPKKPISGNIPRYWAQTALFSSRDYLIPVLTLEKYNSGQKTAEGYLEEYIVEQLEWTEPKENKNDFIILPEEFKSSDSSPRKIDIPEEYTPEIDYNFDYPGMFPGMGGMGGLGGMDGMGDMPDFEGMDDFEMDDSEVDDAESDEATSNNDAVMDAEIIDDESQK